MTHQCLFGCSSPAFTFPPRFCWTTFFTFNRERLLFCGLSACSCSVKCYFSFWYNCSHCCILVNLLTSLAPASGWSTRCEVSYIYSSVQPSNHCIDGLIQPIRLDLVCWSELERNSRIWISVQFYFISPFWYKGQTRAHPVVNTTFRGVHFLYAKYWSN